MDLLGTDITKVAGAYAAFAGVLAGFVFAVMGYLLGNRKQDDGKRRTIALEIGLSWSVLAFVGLSLASFLFALLSGEDRFGIPANGASVGPTRIRPLALSIVASWVLSAAILLLLLGLNWLFSSEKVSWPLVAQLRAVEYFVGLITLFYVDGAFLSVPVAQGKIATDDLGPIAQLGAIWILAIGLGEAVGGLSRWAAQRASDRQKQIVRFATQFFLLLLLMASAFLFNFIDFANEAGSSTWRVLDYQWSGLSALGLVLFLCILNMPDWQLNKKPEEEQGDSEYAEVEEKEMRATNQRT